MTSSTTAAAGTAVVTTTTANARMVDTAARIVLIDSINNNNNNNSNNSSHYNYINNDNTNFNATVFMGGATTTTFAPCPETPTAITPNGNSNNQDAGAEIIEIEPATAESVSPQPRSQKRLSLLNFKSIDFNLKSFYSGLRGKSSQSQSSSLVGVTTTGQMANGSDSISTETPSSAAGGTVGGCRRAATIQHRMTPYLKIETVDSEESENLLLDYPQSPFSSRRNSSPQDNNRSSTQLLNIDRYAARSQAPSPSPYYLSPYGNDPENVRRSSTSDITSCKRSGSSSTSDSRRPSTSDLLRRARERRTTDARMGQRSVSHSGLPRGGRPGGAGGRRTSMAV